MSSSPSPSCCSCEATIRSPDHGTREGAAMQRRPCRDDPRRGRFVVTGSVRADLRQEGWPATGRLVRIDMTGLTQREPARRDLDRGPWLNELAEQGVSALEVPPDPPNLRGYVDLAIAGGFPEPTLQVPARGRTRWLTSYLDRVLGRDVGALGETRDRGRVRRPGSSRHPSPASGRDPVTTPAGRLRGRRRRTGRSPARGATRRAR